MNLPVVEQFIKQQSRGREGFGFFNGRSIIKAAEEKRILRQLRKDRNKSDTILFHHRYPTSTVNVRQAAHPFTTGDYFGDTQYILVHNGIVTNAEDLIEKHQEMGITYSSILPDLTFNDSEALLWDFALTIEGKQESLESTGSTALVCMKLVNGAAEKLYFVRNYGRPLNLNRTPEGVMVSSEGEGEPTKENVLYTYNYALNRLTTRRFLVKGTNYSRSYTAYTGEPTPTYQIPASSQSFSDLLDRERDYTDWKSGHYMNDDGDWVPYQDSDFYEDGEEYEQTVLTGLSQHDRDAGIISRPYSLAEIVADFQPATFKERKEMYKLYLNLDRSTTGFDLLCTYLDSCEGDYDLCYDTMEADYVAYECQPSSIERNIALSTMEEALDLLMKDEDYMDGDIPCNILWSSYSLTGGQNNG